MFKNTFAAFAALLILSSTAFPSNKPKVPKCNANKTTGSYVRQINLYYMDQLKLNNDGTAYWFQSSSFDLMLTAGTYIPEIGSWECLGDGSVLVTTIGTNYDSTGGDIHIAANKRTTQKLTVLDNDTLQPTHRIFTDVLLSDDPFGPGVVEPSSCTPTANPCSTGLYRRVNPQVTDIP